MIEKRIQRRGALAVLLAGWLGVVVSPAAATTLGGGGSKKTDCLAVLETSISPVENERKIVCVDGDPACDVDATVDGQCTFDLAVCVNSSFSENCSLAGVETILVEHAADNGDPKFDPDFQALQDRIDNELDLPDAAPDCTGASLLTVPVQGPYPNDRCKAGKKRVRMTAQSTFDVQAGKSFLDKDTLHLQCRPAPGGCDPQALFDGTYDRIQRQIFDQNCAVSGCHDSESFAGGLLLETGASYTSLVNVAPANFAASQLGWLRIAPGDPAISFLYQKVQGPPDEAFGERMPLGRGKLKGFLREILRLWIVAGAPENGWVAGTD